MHLVPIYQIIFENISISNGKSPKQQCLQGDVRSEKSCLSLCVTYQPQENTFFFLLIEQSVSMRLMLYVRFYTN